MKLKITIILITILSIGSLSAQNLYPNLDDQSGGIAAGYGAWGTENYIRETSVTYANKGVITFYHPDVAITQKATIFFINGWGENVETYDKNLKYIASLGYSVVSIYNYNPGNIQESYANSLFMVNEAVNLYPNWIDTTKIGLMGHSYGAGSTVWLGKEIFGNLNWGTNGRFIMMLAPWFPLLVDDTDLQNYPANVKMLILQSFDDLATQGSSTYNTDPRIIRAMYQLINIPDTDKDFVTIKSDVNPTHTYDFEYNGTTNTYSYEANHFISYTGIDISGYKPYDALDVFSTNRLIHAMTDYVFEGNQAAADVALGNGSANQIAMGIMPNLEVTDTYITVRPETDFNYRCSSGWNDFADGLSVWFLSNYCDDANNDGVIDVLTAKEENWASFSVFPVPSSTLLTIQLTHDLETIEEVLIIAESGKIIKKYATPNSVIDLSSLATGVYFLKVTTQSTSSVKKIIKR